MLGKKIKSLRLSYNLTQVQLADRLGIKKQTVCNWENDNIAPSVEMLRRMAVYFSCSADFLLDLDLSRVILDVNGLTPEQRAHIQMLVDDLRKLNAGLSENSPEKSETPASGNLPDIEDGL